MTPWINDDPEERPVVVEARAFLDVQILAREEQLADERLVAVCQTFLESQ